MSDSAQTIVQEAINQGLTICLDANCIIYYFSGRQPWADRLQPVFEAQTDQRIRLVTSTVTLAEVLAQTGTGSAADQTQQLEASIRRYFDIVPVSDQAGVYAAGIRQGSSVKASDALQAAATADGNATLFITNDEQLVRAPLRRCQAVYLTDMALEWLEDEFTACIDPTVPVVSLAPGQTTLQLELAINPGDAFPLLTPLPADDFPVLALKLAHLVTGPAAVVGVIEGTPDGASRMIAVRLLPAGRPWVLPGVPEWVKSFTGKSHTWHEHEPKVFVDTTLEQVRRFNESAQARGQSERRTLWLMADMSLTEALAAVDALDTDPRNPMKPHRKRAERLKRYLAPLRPLARLWTVDGARLWRGEANNAHRMDLARFANFFALAEAVLGKGGTV